MNSCDAPSPTQEHRTPALDLTAALWRRGMMHAVERIDLVLDKNGKPPRTAKQLRERLALIEDELDRITAFQRVHKPETYDHAFRLCEDELARAQERRGSRKDGSS